MTVVIWTTRGHQNTFVVDFIDNFLITAPDQHMIAGITQDLCQCTSPLPCAQYYNLAHFFLSFLKLPVRGKLDV
jgi:hypothetical protein